MYDDIIDDIKNHFFNEQNNSYLIKIINKENNNETKSEVFQLQNNIFNDFMQSIYDKNIDIDVIPLENIIISLNKMTIIAYNTNTNANANSNNSNLHINVNNNYSLNKNIKGKNIKDKNLSENTSQTSSQTSSQATKKEEILLISGDVQDNILLNEKDLGVKNIIFESKIMNHHIFSDDLLFDKEKFSYKLEQKGECKLLYFELYNDIYNINETNNKFEIDEGVRIKMTIPFGNYNLEELLNTIEKQININKNLSGKYKVLFNKNKNRIQILNESDKNFNIYFIDTKNTFNLRNILGFTNIEYTNNNSYTSENDPCIEYYDDIYIKLDKDPIKTNLDFCYSKHISFDSINTFGKKISFRLEEENVSININSKIEFYIRNCNKFQILNKKLKFNMKFQTFL